MSLYDTMTLPEAIMLAGEERTLYFTVLDEDGSSVSLNSATATWRLADYIDQSQAVLIKTGTVVSGNVWSVELLYADTAELSGKFIHQPIVIEADGKIHPTQQGILTIMPLIPA
jgi:hypothetical protein